MMMLRCRSGDALKETAMRSRRQLLGAAIVALSFGAWSPAASASTIQIGAGAFGPGSTLLDFSGLADGTEVNGLVAGDILFQYSLGSGQVVIDGGPGPT